MPLVTLQEGSPELGDILMLRNTDRLANGRGWLIGRHGAVKSTLLKIMLAELTSRRTGQARRRSQDPFFDRMLWDLARDRIIAKASAKGRDYIKVNGQELKRKTHAGSKLRNEQGL